VQAGDAVSILMLRKVLDMQQSNAAQLIASLPVAPQPLGRMRHLVEASILTPSTVQRTKTSLGLVFLWRVACCVHRQAAGAWHHMTMHAVLVWKFAGFAGAVTSVLAARLRCMQRGGARRRVLALLLLVINGGSARGGRRECHAGGRASCFGGR
jgi:hypothetical protein